MTRDDVIEEAREFARPQVEDVDAFQAEVEEDEAGWMIRFTRPDVLADGAAQHFAVRIDKQFGEKRLFRGR